MAETSGSGAIAIVGAGSIGTGWAVVFATAGHPVRLFEPAADRLRAAADEIAARDDELRACGLFAEPRSGVSRR